MSSWLERMLAHRRASIELLSRHYPIPRELLRDHAELWDWALLSENQALAWDDALLAEHEVRWNFDALAKNPSLPWSVELINDHVARGHWTWQKLGWQPRVYASPDLLASCLPHWASHTSSYPDPRQPCWCANAAEIVERSPGLDWRSWSAVTSFPWTTEFIERHADELDWVLLSRNAGLPWSLELIERFADRWDWQGPLHWHMPYSFELLERFESRVDWRRIGHRHELEWTPALLERFAPRLWWATLDHDDLYEWTGEASGLVEHPAIRWTPALFEQFQADVEAHFARLGEQPENEGWSTDHYWTYHCRPSNWTAEFVEHLIALEAEIGRSTISWPRLCRNARGLWTQEFVARHRRRLILPCLAENPHVPWLDHLELLADAQKEVWAKIAEYAQLGIGLLDAIGEHLPTSSLLRNRSLTREIVEHLHERWDSSDWFEIYIDRQLLPLDLVPDELPWKTRVEITHGRRQFATHIDPLTFDAFVQSLVSEVEARSLEIEAAIARRPDDPARYAIYADWLQLRGDPHGKLIVAMLADDEPEVAALRRDLENRLRIGARDLVWRYGFVREARALDDWRRLLTTRAFALLDTLDINERGPNDDELATLEPLFGTLARLSLRGAPLASPRRLAGATKLRTLNLRDSSIDDLAPLAGLGLRHICLVRTGVERIDAHADLPDLTWLWLAHTKVADLQPLRACTRLVELDLRSTPIRDLSPLHGLQHLRRVHVDIDEREIGRLCAALPQLEVNGASPPRGDIFAVPDDC